MDTTLDRMYEAAVAEEWEKQNRTGRELSPEWDEAIKTVEKVADILSDAKDTMGTAAELVGLSCEVDRINSLADEIGFLMADVKKQAERMTKE